MTISFRKSAIIESRGDSDEWRFCPWADNRASTEKGRFRIPDLGHSRGYIYNISSGKALPPLKEFFAICDYFGLTPAQFFDEGTQNPELIQKAVSGMKQLNEADLLMLLGLINRLLDTNNKSEGT